MGDYAFLTIEAAALETVAATRRACAFRLESRRAFAGWERPAPAGCL